jgi:acetyl esterase
MGTKKISSKQTKKLQKQHKAWRWTLGIIGGLFLLLIAGYAAFMVSPWPGALLIRYEFDKGGRKTATALQKHVPAGVAGMTNLQYASGNKDTKLDVYYPQNTTKPLPTVVWVHGGAWVSGSKENVANYLKIVAAHGYTVVGINYSIAPEKQYPTPVLQTNEALRYLQQNAEKLHINPQQFVLAGDSAGSQIAAQVATIISNPQYAQEVKMSAPLTASQLKAVVLNCGAYDLALPNYNGTDGKFLKTVLWAYAGDKNFLADQDIQHASVVDYVNKNFPPAFITAGNVDPLEPQSREFSSKLNSLGVPTSTLFYAKNHQPELPHEYQFNLDTQDGQQALQQILLFLKDRT